MPDDNNTVAAQLAERISHLERAGLDATAMLQELTDNGVLHVAGSQYAGITLAEGGKAVTNVVATHRYAKDVDAVQGQCGEGPCLAAAWEHQMMLVADLRADERWPRYRREVLERTPIRSILSYELFVDGTAMAALNFYAEKPHAFTEDSLELGRVFATHTALAWSMMRRRDQFRSALASRDIIGQAKGVLMERFDFDAVEAFELLTRLSQQTNTKVIDIAAKLIDSDHPLKRRHR
jgi:GAF domain-containing protein